MLLFIGWYTTAIITSVSSSSSQIEYTSNLTENCRPKQVWFKSGEYKWSSDFVDELGRSCLWFQRRNICNLTLVSESCCHCSGGESKPNTGKVFHFFFFFFFF